MYVSDLLINKISTWISISAEINNSRYHVVKASHQNWYIRMIHEIQHINESLGLNRMKNYFWDLDEIGSSRKWLVIDVSSQIAANWKWMQLCLRLRITLAPIIYIPDQNSKFWVDLDTICAAFNCMKVSNCGVPFAIRNIHMIMRNLTWNVHVYRHPEKWRILVLLSTEEGCDSKLTRIWGGTQLSIGCTLYTE